MQAKKLQKMPDILVGLVEAMDHEDGVCVDLGDNTIASLMCGIPKRQYIGGSGALGGSLSVAMGHSLVNDNFKGEIFCIVGDGGFGLHFNSLITAAMNPDKVKRLTVIVLNDSSWSMTGGQRITPTSLGINYEALGKALNLPYCRAVYDHKELEKACKDAKEIPGTKLIIANCLSL
ncbi:MAG: thiamine pyrophosphate-dependent enzyme [Candidatus Hydrothermarchaeota archaeon]